MSCQKLDDLRVSIGRQQYVPSDELLYDRIGLPGRPESLTLCEAAIFDASAEFRFETQSHLGPVSFLWTHGTLGRPLYILVGYAFRWPQLMTGYYPADTKPNEWVLPDCKEPANGLHALWQRHDCGVHG